jgi:hypothetical protein
MANHPPHFKEWPIVIPAKARAVLLSISIFMLYGFWCRETAAFHPNNSVTHFDTRQLTPSDVRIQTFFGSGISASVPDGQKKNIIVIQLGDFELQMIGRYGSRWVFSTPFLTNLSQQTLFARNVLLEQLTPLGAGALYTALCSMPVNKNPQHINVLFKSGNNSRLHCLGDFLDQLGGYTVVTYEAGKGGYGGLQPTLTKHGIRNIKNFPHDKEMFDDLEKALPDLAAKPPFALYISNVDTRPPIHAVCPYRSWMYKNHQQYKAVDCIDQYLEAFFTKLDAVGLNPKNTQIVIFGDGLRSDLNKHPIPLFKDPRRLFVMFPFAPKRYISKQVTLYDITPTLLDLAGIQYAPKQPFGGNVVHAPNGIPSNKDYDAIYQRFAAK